MCIPQIKCRHVKQTQRNKIRPNRETFADRASEIEQLTFSTQSHTDTRRDDIDDVVDVVDDDDDADCGDGADKQ